MSSLPQRKASLCKNNKCLGFDNGEGNGNPLQCSCLENPRDRGAWWAAIYGVTQSRTRLAELGSPGGAHLRMGLTSNPRGPGPLLTCAVIRREAGRAEFGSFGVGRSVQQVLGHFHLLAKTAPSAGGRVSEGSGAEQ